MKFANRFLLPPFFVLCVVAAFADEPATAATASKSVSAETLETIDQAKSLFVEALQSEGKSRVEGLRKSYETMATAAAADSVLPPARTIWAKMLMSVGDEKSAAATLQQSVSENPDDPEAFVMLANQAAKRGHLAEAQLAYDAAAVRTQSMPDDNLRRRPLEAQIAAGMATVAQARSVLAVKSGNRSLAAEFDQDVLTHLRHWVDNAPENASAHDRLAAASLRNGDMEAAVAAFDRARQLNPSLPLTDLRLAQSHIAGGNAEAANERLDRAVAEHSADADVLVSAADLLLVMGELDKAEQQIQAAMKLDPESLSARRLQAQLLRFRGQWESAAEQLQRLNTEHPTDFETANLLATTLCELGDDERRRALSLATVTAQRFDLDSPQGRRARISLIWAAHTAGKVDAAKQALNQLLGSGIESNRISGDEGYYLARLLVDFGRPELAAPLVESVLSRIGSFPKRSAAESLAAQLK